MSGTIQKTGAQISLEAFEGDAEGRAFLAAFTAYPVFSNLPTAPEQLRDLVRSYKKSRGDQSESIRRVKEMWYALEKTQFSPDEKLKLVTAYLPYPLIPDIKEECLIFGLKFISEEKFSEGWSDNQKLNFLLLLPSVFQYGLGEAMHPVFNFLSNLQYMNYFDQWDGDKKVNFAQDLFQNIDINIWKNVASVGSLINVFSQLAQNPYFKNWTLEQTLFLLSKMSEKSGNNISRVLNVLANTMINLLQFPTYLTSQEFYDLALNVVEKFGKKFDEVLITIPDFFKQSRVVLHSFFGGKEKMILFFYEIFQRTKHIDSYIDNFKTYLQAFGPEPFFSGWSANQKYKLILHHLDIYPDTTFGFNSVNDFTDALNQIKKAAYLYPELVQSIYRCLLKIKNEKSFFYLGRIVSFLENSVFSETPHYVNIIERFLPLFSSYNETPSLRVLDAIFQKKLLQEFKGNFLLFVEKAVTRFPKLIFPVLEGIKEILENKKDFPEFTEQQVFDFIQKSNGLNPILFKKYLIEGDSLFESIEVIRRKILDDEFTFEEIKVLLEAEGKSEEEVLALIQITLRTSGASFVKSEERLRYFARRIKLGDKTFHIPPEWKKISWLQNSGILAFGSYELKEGTVFDPDGKLHALKSLFLQPEPKDRLSETQMMEALQDYLKSEHSEKDRQKIFHFFCRYHGQTRNIDYRGDEPYSFLNNLSQKLTDKDELPLEINKIFSKLSRDFLFSLTKISDDPMKKNKILNVKGVIKSIRKIIEDSSLSSIEKNRSVSSVLRPFLEDSIRNDLLISPLLSPEEKDFIESAMNRGGLVNMKNTIDEILKEAREAVQKEKDKFEYKTSGKVGVRFKPVKSAAYSIWPMNAGVCIYDDTYSWNLETFRLFAYQVSDVLKTEVPFTESDLKSVEGFVATVEYSLKGNKYLGLVGINPTQEFLSQVDEEKLYELTIRKLKNYARKTGIKEIHIPTSTNIFSNRTGLQRIVVKKKYPIMNLKQSIKWHATSHNFEQVYRISVDPQLSLMKKTEAPVTRSLKPTATSFALQKYATLPRQSFHARILRGK